MAILHLSEERPDPNRLPISAAVWDETKGYSSGNNEATAALFRAIKQLEIEVTALRAKR